MVDDALAAELGIRSKVETVNRALAEVAARSRRLTALDHLRAGLVAATALVHDATVLHDDRDFDLISRVSDLSARWIVPPGTGHGRQA